MNEIDFSVTNINHIIQRPCRQSWNVEETCHLMVIVLEGEAYYTILGQSFIARKHDVLIFSPGVVRHGKTNPKNPWTFISVNFNLQYNSAAEVFFNKPYLHFTGIGEHLRNQFADIAYSWEGKNPLYHIRCRNLATDILYDIINAQLPHNKVPHQKKLESARTYMQASFRDEIQIEALAERLGFSPSYFRKLFKDAYGIAPMQYITNLRIGTAKDLLLSGELNVTEAARLSGFDDIYYFSTLFKKQMGYSPTQFIKANR